MNIETMPIGRATVALIFDQTGLLCVQRGWCDPRKVKLNRRWWKRAETFLKNDLKPPIEVEVQP